MNSLLTLVMLCASTGAAAQQFTLRSGAAVMKVDAAHGGKITSLTLDGQELLAQHRKVEGMRFENMNDFGSTFWPSPQSEWNWPPIATYDSQPYTVAAATDSLLQVVSGRDTRYPYIIEKTFAALGEGRYTVAYRIVNDSDLPVTVAPWEITRVPSGGEIRFEAQDIRPADEVQHHSDGGVITIPFVPVERKNRKIFADAKGWLEFRSDGLRFTKRFADISHSQAAPGEEEVEVYYNAGTTYTEIENQGPYTTILPHDSVTWIVDWEISK